MALESGSFIDDLDIANPLGTDAKNKGDDHLRLIKKVVKATFPGLGGAAWRVQAKSSAYTVVAGDNMTVINCTAALTLSLTAAATLGNQHFFVVIANGGNVTIDPNGAETINSASEIVIPDGIWALVACNATLFLAMTAAGIGAANTFTADQTLESTEAGSGVGPTLSLYRNSSSPAASDNLGGYQFQGESSTGVKRTYADLIGFLIDPTNASEDGRIIFRTMIAGTFANRLLLQDGLFTQGATGGDKGAGTINASAIYDDGVQILPISQANQAALEAETNEDTYTPPDLVRHSPGMGKVWVKFDLAGTVNASHNVDSVTDSAAGDWTVNITTDFSSADYAILTAHRDAGIVGSTADKITFVENQAAGTFRFIMFDIGSAALQDPAAADDMHAAAFGDQA